MTEYSPEELVAKIHAGEQLAEQQLVNQYWRSLYFILNRRANDPELAADMTQETFIIVINKARNGQIENPAALSAFIRQIGVNLLIANFRKESRRKTDVSEDIDVQYPDLSTDVLKSLNSQKIGRIVTQVMDELPTERDKDLLYRYFVYGQTKQLLCEEFDLTPAHFDRVLYRARNRLKQILEMRMGVDINTVGLSSLLGVLILFGFLHSETNQSNPVTQISSPPMRELSNTQHISNKSVTERPSYKLEGKQHQKKTRWA